MCKLPVQQATVRLVNLTVVAAIPNDTFVIPANLNRRFLFLQSRGATASLKFDAVVGNDLGDISLINGEKLILDTVVPTSEINILLPNSGNTLIVYEGELEE